MDTVTESKKSKKKNHGNGSSGAETKSEAPPVEVRLEEVDSLKLALLTEKSRRIDAERSRLDSESRSFQSENVEFTRALSEKYGVDFQQYSINLDTGIATRRK